MATKNLQYDSGRSMVEMLGTLAIIGVLSVGGIAGYSYGMDKYKANQTINDVMLMGVDMITQLSQNRGIPTLSEWGTKTTAGYDFTVVLNPEDETQYGIQISGVPARVCKMVGDALKPMASVYVNDDEHITEEDPCDESDNNTMEFYFATGAVESDGCKTDADCGDGRYCDNGWCFKGHNPEVTVGFIGGTCKTDADCNTGWTGNNCAVCDSFYGCIEDWTTRNATCTLTDSNVAGKCGSGLCNPSGCTYDTNKCGKNEYCASSNNSCEQAFQSDETGMCIAANMTFSRLPGTTHYISDTATSWWDADAGCKALGREGLVSVSDLINGWDGKDDWSCYDTSGCKRYEFTALGKTLQNHLGTFWSVWTENPTDDPSSCTAYHVNLAYGCVGAEERNNRAYNCGNRYAVCK